MLTLELLISSQQLSDDTEMSLLKVLKARELSVKVLSQVKHLLTYIKYLILAHAADSYKSLDNMTVDQISFA
jgi:hypothetical protein